MRRKRIKYWGIRLVLLLGFYLVINSFVIIERNNELTDISPSTDKEIPEFYHKKSITDGPYIFYEKGKIVVRWIKNDQPRVRTISGNNSKLFRKNFGFEIDPECLEINKERKVDYKQTYSDVEKFVAISDPHGQFDVFVDLLKQYKIIDQQYNWIYGTGHLVILGDILDRGDKVTELLWLTYRLEKQAEKAGGKVHYMIGNHELMVLNNDVRYIHDKYIATSKKMHMVYSQMFAENTFFGQWIKTKPVMIIINDILFVHAGISTDFLRKNITVEQTNKVFHENIVGQSWDVILNDSISSFLMGTSGPLWNRGYFNGKTRQYQVDHILRYFNVDHIIVGHTSIPNIISLFNNKVIGIDANIKEGNYGEILIYENKEFYRGTLNGSIMKLDITTN